MAQTHTLSHPQVPFAVRSGTHEGHLSLDLNGELDLACTDLLASVGHDDDRSVHDVTVDLSRLEFIDTAGVRELIEVRKRHVDRGRTFRMVNPVELVRKVVGLYGRPDLLAG